MFHLARPRSSIWALRGCRRSTGWGRPNATLRDIRKRGKKLHSPFPCRMFESNIGSDSLLPAPWLQQTAWQNRMSTVQTIKRKIRPRHVPTLFHKLDTGVQLSYEASEAVTEPRLSAVKRTSHHLVETWSWSDLRDESLARKRKKRRRKKLGPGKRSFRKCCQRPSRPLPGTQSASISPASKSHFFTPIQGGKETSSFLYLIFNREPVFFALTSATHAQAGEKNAPAHRKNPPSPFF